MDPQDADQAPEARPPLLEGLVSLCRHLNDEGARYVVIGGMAVIQAGQAVRDMTADDLEQYAVVRVADEIVVDLMTKACGIGYSEASQMVEEVDVEGVRTPSPELGCSG